MKKTDIRAGESFGWLTVLKEGNPRGARHLVTVLCRCQCGKTVEIVYEKLRRGITKSCGCYAKARLSERVKTHGMTRTATYRTWLRMRGRCSRPTNNRFHIYGGRGIKVCERWKDSFANFLADMGPRPSSKHSIGRIDNNGNYEPSNCRWETPAQQKANRSDNVVVEYLGVKRPLFQWCEMLHLGYSTARWRLRAGWSAERAFTAPVQ